MTANPVYWQIFNYYIVGSVVEFINNVEQHSYEKLTENWWINCFKTVTQYNNIPTEVVKLMLVNRVLNVFPKLYKNDLYMNDLYEQISHAYDNFLDACEMKHNCGLKECDGECGVQPCGVCIDCCRCDIYID
jgi:hypothetical protein